MKNLLFYFFIVCVHIGYTQIPPDIDWDNTIGGNNTDNLRDMVPTPDGGYILVGSSNSPASFDKSEDCIGNEDYWVVKLDANGAMEWQNTIGGNDMDIATSVTVASDNGYLVGGYSISDSSGDKSEDHIGFSPTDCWIVKLDSAGNIEWENTIGGNDNDFLRDVAATADGGYILGIESSSSISGDKTENSMGGPDYWVVKLFPNGDIEWQNTIGGSLGDIIVQVLPTNDGEYLIGGYSYSGISGDKTEPVVYASIGDIWLVKLDSLGNILWQNTIGGDWADYFTSVFQTSDNGYIVSAESGSDSSGDKSDDVIGFAFIYRTDFWIIKLDSIGNIEWDKTIGGDSTDIPVQIIENSNKEYICVGSSNSGNHDKSDHRLGLFFDYWVIKLDSAGNKIWDKTLGGYGSDYARNVCLSADGSLIIAGTSNSDSSIYKSENALDPTGDFWILQLNCDQQMHLFADLDGDGYGDVLHDTLVCKIPDIGFVLDSTDCNDNDPDIFPGAPEIYDGLDNNCNGLTDEGLVDIISNNVDFTMHIFPNPNDGIFVINGFIPNTNDQIYLEENKRILVEIFSMMGELMYSSEITSTGGKIFDTIDLRYLPAGIYLLKLGVNSIDYRIKFIKE